MLRRKDQKLQQQIDHEIRMQDGAKKLLKASKNPNQLLEAAKNLLTSNARTWAYMGELQRRKTDEVLQRETPSDGNQVPCKARVSVSDLRVPLLWREGDHFKNKGDHRRYAVFCLVKIGTEIYDTSLLKNVDRSLTDILFDDVITFDNISQDFECRVEVYCHRCQDDLSVASTPKRIRKRIEDFGNSVGRTVGKRLSGIKDDSESSMIIGPKFECIGNGTLKLKDIDDVMGTYDLNLESESSCGADLPLFGNFCCRLIAQPDCLINDTITGDLYMQDPDSLGWEMYWCRLCNLSISCWKDQKQSQDSPPDTTIPITKTTQVSEVPASLCQKSHCIQISSNGGRFNIAAPDAASKTKWWDAIYQHLLDQVMWLNACERLMEVRTSGLLRHSSYKKSGRVSSLYEEMSLDDPSSPMTKMLNRLNIPEKDEAGASEDTETSETNKMSICGKNVETTPILREKMESAHLEESETVDNSEKQDEMKSQNVTSTLKEQNEELVQSSEERSENEPTDEVNEGAASSNIVKVPDTSDSEVGSISSDRTDSLPRSMTNSDSLPRSLTNSDSIPCSMTNSTDTSDSGIIDKAGTPVVTASTVYETEMEQVLEKTGDKIGSETSSERVESISASTPSNSSLQDIVSEDPPSMEITDTSERGESVFNTDKSKVENSENNESETVVKLSESQPELNVESGLSMSTDDGEDFESPNKNVQIGDNSEMVATPGDYVHLKVSKHFKENDADNSWYKMMRDNSIDCTLDDDDDDSDSEELSSKDAAETVANGDEKSVEPEEVRASSAVGTESDDEHLEAGIVPDSSEQLVKCSNEVIISKEISETETKPDEEDEAAEEITESSEEMLTEENVASKVVPESSDAKIDKEDVSSKDIPDSATIVCGEEDVSSKEILVSPDTLCDEDNIKPKNTTDSSASVSEEKVVASTEILESSMPACEEDVASKESSGSVNLGEEVTSEENNLQESSLVGGKLDSVQSEEAARRPSSQSQDENSNQSDKPNKIAKSEENDQITGQSEFDQIVQSGNTESGQTEPEEVKVTEESHVTSEECQQGDFKKPLSRSNSQETSV